MRSRNSILQVCLEVADGGAVPLECGTLLVLFLWLKAGALSHLARRTSGRATKEKSAEKKGRSTLTLQKGSNAESGSAVSSPPRFR